MCSTSLSKIASDKENLERMLHSLMEGIIAHDKDRRIFFFNRAAERITGFSRREVLGKDCHEAFREPFCGGRCSFCGEPPDSWTQTDYLLNIVTKDGERRRIEMSVTGMTGKTGELVGVIAAFRDVTDLLGLQMELGKLTCFYSV